MRRDGNLPAREHQVRSVRTKNNPGGLPKPAPILDNAPMRPTFEELSALVNTVEAGSVTAAALRMRTTKSVVSARLSALERKLQVALFLRSGREMQLTEAGLLAYKTAVGLLAGVDGLMDEAAGHSSAMRGVIRVAGPRSFGNRYLNGVISAFLVKNPDLEIRLDLDDQLVDILSAGFDFSIRVGHLTDSSFKARKLGVSERSLLCSPGYAAEHGMPESPEALKRHACLGHSNLPPAKSWSFSSENGDERVALNPDCRLLSSSGETILDATIDGLGLSILPLFLANEAIRAGKLIPITMPGWSVPSETIYAIYPSALVQPRKVRTLIDEIARSLMPLPWEGVVLRS